VVTIFALLAKGGLTMWMRTGLTICILGLVTTEPAFAEMWVDLDAYTPQQLSEMKQKRESAKKQNSQKKENSNAKVASATSSAVAAEANQPTSASKMTSGAARPQGPIIAKATPSFSPPPTTSFTVLLRKDFSDITLFTSPTPTKNATGAEFSLTRDLIANNTTWLADATVAAAYSYLNEDIRQQFIGVAVAPYVMIDRQINSTVASQNVDQRTLGVSGEVGFRNLLLGGSDYLRGSGAEMVDNIKATTVTHGAVEWLPTYTWLAAGVPGTYANYNFTPEVEAQFDSTNQRGKTILFSGQQDSLRLGPQAQLWLGFNPPNGSAVEFLSRLYGTLTYHWWTEMYSNKT